MSFSACPKMSPRRALLLSAAIFLLPAAPSSATDIVVSDGETVTDTVFLLDVGDSLTVESGGIIDTSATFDASGASADNNNQTVTNKGTIIAERHGIRSNGINNTIENSGSIRALLGHGINITTGTSIDAQDNVVTNTGRIDAALHGIRTDTAVVGTTIYNEGTIFAGIHGIRSYGAGEMIKNSGTIVADDIGILVDGDNTFITNSGFVVGKSGISVSTTANASDAVFYLNAGSVLDGLVELRGSDPTLNIGSGLNLFLDYDGVVPVVNSKVPIVHDTANTLIYTIDPSGFALSQSFMQTTADAVHNAVLGATSLGNGTGGGFAGDQTFAYAGQAPGFEDSGPRGWVSGFGGYQSQNGSGFVTGGDQAYGGLVAGGGFASSDRMFGVFAGGSYSQLESDHDTQKIDAASVYGGIYGGAALGANWINANFAVGYTSFDSDRTVANNMVSGGLETASARYDGYFISPSLTVGRSIGDRTELSFGGHYAGLFLDGYRETGSAANLTVSGRDVHVAAVRGQVKYLAHQKSTANGQFSVETWAGLDGLFNLNGEDVEATVAGVALNFPASFSDSAAVGFAGVGVNHKPTSGNWSFNASLEGRYGSDSFAEIRATGGASMKF